MTRQNRHKDGVSDAEGRHLWTNTLFVCLWHAQNVAVRTDFGGERRDFTWNQTRFLPKNGRNDQKQFLSVPLYKVSNKVEQNKRPRRISSTPHPRVFRGS